MRSASTASDGHPRERSASNVSAETPKRKRSNAIPRTVSAAGSTNTPARSPARSRARTADPASPTALHSTSRAVAIAEGLRRADTEFPRKPQRRVSGAAMPRLRPRFRLNGDFEQAVADGALEAARISLELRIRAHLPKGALEVTLTNNRYTMISVRRDSDSGPRYRVRLHHMFSDAGSTVTRALARYIVKNDRRASHLLGDFIDAHQHRVRPRTVRAVAPKLITEGKHHDLEAIFDDLNRAYFGDAIKARITWGQKCGKPRRRNSIKMGSYSVEDRLIRVHRSLDRAFVPRFFVEWIVFHEMLHQVHPVTVKNGRRRFHTKAFLEDEARFDRYAESRAWEREHLDELLTY